MGRSPYGRRLLSFTLIVLTQIGSPAGVHLLDDAPPRAQVAPLMMPSDAQVSAQQLQVDIDALRKQRPSLGGGIALVSTGGGLALLGGLYLVVSVAIPFGGALSPLLILGVIGLAVGLPLAGVGVWLLFTRIADRQRIDEEIKSLRQQLQLVQPRTPYQQQPRQYQPPSQDIPPPQVSAPDSSMLIARF